LGRRPKFVVLEAVFFSFRTPRGTGYPQKFSLITRQSKFRLAWDSAIHLYEINFKKHINDRPDREIGRILLIKFVERKIGQDGDLFGIYIFV